MQVFFWGAESGDICCFTKFEACERPMDEVVSHNELGDLSVPNFIVVFRSSVPGYVRTVLHPKSRSHDSSVSVFWKEGSSASWKVLSSSRATAVART